MYLRCINSLNTKSFNRLKTLNSMQDSLRTYNAFKQTIAFEFHLYTSGRCSGIVYVPRLQDDFVLITKDKWVESGS